MKKRQIKVIVNGITYDVEIGDMSTSPISVIVNGDTYEVVLPPEEDGQEVDHSPVIQKVSPKPAQAPVTVSSVKREPSSTISSSDDVKAPMPGTILNIAVKPGEKVTRGDQICALEAMKMKSAIHAPKDGVIASVEVSEGQKVVFGDPLVRYV